jgi:hypothetical protein
MCVIQQTIAFIKKKRYLSDKEKTKGMHSKFHSWKEWASDSPVPFEEDT